MRKDMRMVLGVAVILANLGGRAAVQANSLVPVAPAIPSSLPGTHPSPVPGNLLDPATSRVPDSTNGWGYGYDSLLKDLALWRESPYVRIDSIGASVEGRALWMVTITEGEISLGGSKRRVFIHARTHPSEVQANYVANEAIAFLLDSGSLSRAIRRGHIFNIIPMYNPDGVEKGPGRDHGYGRLNANRVDLESNWDKPNLQPEVLALRAQFDAFMAGPVPVEVALNLHSDRISCARFFFFHGAGGTSSAYELLEKEYIGKVQNHFPGGIKDYNHVVSWETATATQYPESYWWLTFRERVMALTYEDANCPNASAFDSTAVALVRGSVDYLRGRIIAATRALARGETRWLLEPGGIRIHNPASGGWARWTTADVTGRNSASGNLAADGGVIPLRRGANPVILVLATEDGKRRERILLASPSR